MRRLSNITNFDTDVRKVLQNIGVQTTEFILDALGVPTSIAESNSMNVVNQPNVVAKTGFYPNLKKYSIEETVEGMLQNFGSEEVDSGVDYANWDALSSTEVETTSSGVRLISDGSSFLAGKSD